MEASKCTEDKVCMAAEFVNTVAAASEPQHFAEIEVELKGFTLCDALIVAEALTDEAIEQLIAQQEHGFGQNWVELAKLVKQAVVTTKSFMCDVAGQGESVHKVAACTDVNFALAELDRLEAVVKELKGDEAGSIVKFIKYIKATLKVVKDFVCVSN
jgi:hypothetical protein